MTPAAPDLVPHQAVSSLPSINTNRATNWLWSQGGLIQRPTHRARLDLEMGVLVETADPDSASLG